MKKRNLLYLFSFVFIAGSVLSCSKEKVIPRDKMVAILHDIQLAETLHQVKFSDFQTKSQKDALVEGVLMKHGITQAQLDSSLVWYSDNVELYNRVNDSVISTFKREVSRINMNAPEDFLTKRKDYVLLPEHFYLSELQPALTFNIDSAGIKYFPDFKVRFKSMWVADSTDVEFLVSYMYADTVITQQDKVINDSVYIATIPNLNDSTLKNISGYIRLNSQKIPDRKVLLYNIMVTDSIRKVKTDTIATNTNDSIMINKDTLQLQ